MISVRRALRERVERLDPGAMDRLLVWSAVAVGIIGSTAAWLFV